MKRHLPLLGIVLFACAASFGPVVFRGWVLQHDIDGGGHTISNATFSGTQGTLGPTSAITGSNATLNGWLKLSGQTNRIGDNGTALTFNGTAIGGGGDTIWTNESGVVHPTATNNSSVQFKRNVSEDSYSQSALNLADHAAYQLTKVSKNSENSNWEQHVDLAGAGTAEDPYYFFMLGNLAGNDVTVIDPTLAGFLDAAGAVVAYKCDTYYTATNGQMLLSVANKGTNKVTVDFSGLITSVAGFAKGAFTGITTTNTFYSVTSDLLSTKTNVVVVQGGIITGWTVTP